MEVAVFVTVIPDISSSEYEKSKPVCSSKSVSTVFNGVSLKSTLIISCPETTKKHRKKKKKEKSVLFLTCIERYRFLVFGEFILNSHRHKYGL